MSRSRHPARNHSVMIRIPKTNPTFVFLLTSFALTIGCHSPHGAGDWSRLAGTWEPLEGVDKVII